MRGVFLAVLMLATAGCGITDPSGVTLHFEGTVTAQATGQPLAGIRIGLGDPTILWDLRASTTTDSQGHYSLAHSLDPCIDGAFGIVLSASATGFESQTVQPACTSSLQQIDFSLTPAP